MIARIALLFATAIFLCTSVLAQSLDLDKIIGHWVLDSPNFDHLLEGEIERLESEGTDQAKKDSKRIEKAKNKMYSDLTLNNDGTFELSVGMVGGSSEVMQGYWSAEMEHIMLSWGSNYKMHLTYKNGMLIFYADGRPHKLGDGSTPIMLRKVSELQHRMRHNIYMEVVKKFGIGKVFGILGIVMFVLLGLGILSIVLNKNG